MKFKKISTLLLAGAFLVSASASDKVITMGTIKNFPLLNIAKIAKADLEKQGYTVEITEFTDYTVPNVALASKEIDANFIQHKPYMQVFSKKLKSNFVTLTPVYNTYVALYSKEHKSIKDLPKDAKIALPSDPVNHAWGLKVLSEQGLITLGEKKGPFYTVDDILENPKNITIDKIAIPALSQAYQEYDLVMNWPSHMVKMGVNPLKHGLVVIDDKKSDELHAVTVVTREDIQDTQKMQDLKKAMTSEEVKEFLEKEYSEEGYPVF